MNDKERLDTLLDEVQRLTDQIFTLEFEIDRLRSGVCKRCRSKLLSDE